MAQRIEEKTNVMRILDRERIPYVAHIYSDTAETNGVMIAERLGEDPNRCFKTLVTVGRSGNKYVFVIPVNHELDLKKAAASVGEKSVEMLKAKELLPLTGYVHGGCSPIGMKKFFKTVVDISAESFETIYFSAGKIGFQVELSLSNLGKVIPIGVSDIIS